MDTLNTLSIVDVSWYNTRYFRNVIGFVFILRRLTAVMRTQTSKISGTGGEMTSEWK